MSVQSPSEGEKDESIPWRHIRINPKWTDDFTTLKQITPDHLFCATGSCKKYENVYMTFFETAMIYYCQNHEGIKMSLWRNQCYGGLQNDAGSDESFLKLFNHKKSASLLRCCRVDKSSTLIPKSLRSLNHFQDGNVCLFLLFCVIFGMHLCFVVIMSFNWWEIWIMLVSVFLAA